MKNKTIIILNFLALILYLSCGKEVVNMPILIEMNGLDTVMDAEDFEEQLIEKLEGYNFKIVPDSNMALYIIYIDDFYSEENSTMEDAPYDDCYSTYYMLNHYYYGIKAHILDIKNDSIPKEWNFSDSKSDEIKDDGENEGCTVYEVNEPFFTASYFFNTKANRIAREISRIISVR